MDFPERIFFITTVTWRRILFFHSERASRLFLHTLCGYRDRGVFQLYEFVIMPDHIHLMLAPKATISLERAMQFIKGGYSHRYMKETGSRAEIWERSFTNHRIRDWDDYLTHRRYIHLNPVRAGLCQLPQDYLYSSASPGHALDAAPPRLKPVALNLLDRGAEKRHASTVAQAELQNRQESLNAGEGSNRKGRI